VTGEVLRRVQGLCLFGLPGSSGSGITIRTRKSGLPGAARGARSRTQRAYVRHWWRLLFGLPTKGLMVQGRTKAGGGARLCSSWALLGVVFDSGEE